MPSRSKKSKAALTAAELANIAKARPYIERVIEDAELRDNIRAAVDSTRSAYGRLSNGKAPTKALIEDKKLHADLRVAADALRDASAAGRARKRRLAAQPGRRTFRGAPRGASRRLRRGPASDCS